MQRSSDPPTCINPEITASRTEALRRIRRGASTAYFQGAMSAIVAVDMASAGDPAGERWMLIAGAVVVALGAWLGRGRAAAPAALLIVIVLAFAVWLWSGGLHLLAVLLVAGLAREFAHAYRAARALAALGGAGRPLTAAP